MSFASFPLLPNISSTFELVSDVINEKITIPQNILQTYKTAHLEQWTKEQGKYNRTEWFLSWQNFNPNYKHIVLNDSAAIEFIDANFDNEISNAYLKMPLVVLRADMLRYAMMWILGGIYTDSDTICRKSIREWIGEYSDASLLVSIEWYKNTIDYPGEKYHHTQLVQWTFAATNNHPVFWNLLEKVTKKVNEASVWYLKSIQNVEEIGGPQIFTKTIEEYMNLQNETLNSLENGTKRRVYFPKSRVLVLPHLSFAAVEKDFGTEFAFSSHVFKGFDVDEGWKNGKGVIAGKT
ncbi:membrane-bound alpha-1,6- mannosyltransferase Initiation-specific [Physocladia obscura]|uniref:Membrane-bound alpha-1,6- mannosyltransferase Initiation-specific n=1 Tax=Physocladia obscura TaxID=109957 RepID=A0AAD5SY49_9FUNG|nr:membrane-bound alpha-1,6- mannosyltransferase Initiation-specific [Physocladia obscura]